MKIELKLTAPEVCYACDRLIVIQHINPNNAGRSKNSLSILLDVLDKINAKTMQIHRKQAFLLDKKKHKISLKYHEAITFLEFLNLNWVFEGSDVYNKNLHRKIVLQLDQKLA